MVNPGFYSDSHWRFKVQFGAVDMRRRVWNGKLYNADNAVVFEWQSTLRPRGKERSTSATPSMATSRSRQRPNSISKSRAADHINGRSTI
jgi:hypothetical protein